MDEHLAENYKILKQYFFKSIRQYDIIHSYIKYEGICVKEALPKRKISVNAASLIFFKELSILLTLLQRVHLWLISKGQ